MIGCKDIARLLILEEVAEELFRLLHYFINYLDVPHIFLVRYEISE